MNKRVLIFIFSVIFIVVVCAAANFLINYYENTKDSRSEQFPIKVSEMREPSQTGINTGVNVAEITLKEKEIIKHSDLIVKGKLTKEVGAYDILPEVGDPVPQKLYAFELYEVLKGKVDKIKIAIPAIYPDPWFKVNEEYIFCLYYLNGDYEDTYRLFSYQGVYRFEGNTITNNSYTTTIQNLKKAIQSEKLVMRIIILALVILLISIEISITNIYLNKKSKKTSKHKVLPKENK